MQNVATRMSVAILFTMKIGKKGHNHYEEIGYQMKTHLCDGQAVEKVGEACKKVTFMV